MKLFSSVLIGLSVLNAAAFFHPHEGAAFLDSHAVGISQIQHLLTPPEGTKTVIHLKEPNNPVYLVGSPLHPDSHGESHESHGHGHGEEAHGEESEHHASPAEQHESLGLACFLMGTVGAIMFLFYLVNSRSIGIRLSTWRVLNMTVSIFVAVLLYGSLKMFILHMFEPSFELMVCITLALFFVFYLGTSVALFFLKGGDPEQLEASGTVLAHITGFAAMYGFADAREVEFFEQFGAPGLILLIVVAALVIGVLSFITDFVMQKVAGNRVDEAEERWMETCDETDDDVFCLAISFLFVILFRYLIRGKAEPYEPGEIGNVTQGDANALLLFAVGFALLVGIGAVVIIKQHQRLSRSKTRKRVVSNFQHLNSMIMSWSFLFWAEWQLYVWGWESTVIGGCIVVAFFLTGLSFSAVFLLNCASEQLKSIPMAKRAMGSLELALGVLVGFSWERAFDVGFEEVEHALKHSPGVVPAPVTVALMSIVLLVIVTPAWRYYILPKVGQLEGMEMSASK